MNAKQPMTQSRLERLLKALPALEGKVLCAICEEIKIKMHRNYPDVAAVIRDPATKQQQPLCSLCAIERAMTNDVSFVDIEVAVRIRRYFIEHPQTCYHCFGVASRWCALCAAPICDAAITQFLRRSCLCERCTGLALEEEQARLALIIVDGD